jgi:hypothetical protein
MSSAAQTPALVAYDEQRMRELLRDWTPRQVLAELQAGRLGGEMPPDERAELVALLTDWARRALDMVPLRDALLVDQQRGARVYPLLVQMLITRRAALPDALAHALRPAGADGAAVVLSPQQVRQALDALDSSEQAAPAARALLEQAEAHHLTLAWQPCAAPCYPLPANLEQLVPPPPAVYREPEVRFEQPVGWRRTLAIMLAAGGICAFGVPLLLGQAPSNPAGVPLGLLTLALMVGIRAGRAGYAGAFLIWLVPNLPLFHYGTTPERMLQAVPLLLLGLLLLALDRHVRALWRWIRRGGRA